MTTPQGDHKITSIYTPVSERIVCSCGWNHTETRRQNALARAAKVRAAIRKHLENRSVQTKGAGGSSPG